MLVPFEKRDIPKAADEATHPLTVNSSLSDRRVLQLYEHTLTTHIVAVAYSTGKNIISLDMYKLNQIPYNNKNITLPWDTEEMMAEMLN